MGTLIRANENAKNFLRENGALDDRIIWEMEECAINAYNSGQDTIWFGDKFLKIAQYCDILPTQNYTAWISIKSKSFDDVAEFCKNEFEATDFDHAIMICRSLGMLNKQPNRAILNIKTGEQIKTFLLSDLIGA